MFEHSIKRMLDSLAKGQLHFAGPQPTPPAKPSALDQNRQTSAFYPPQFHPFTEIIFGLSGKPLIYENDRWLSFAPGSALVFLPGAIHSERYVRKNANYQLLWTTITSQSVNFHITAWTPSNGYHLPNSRISLQLSAGERLTALLSNADLQTKRLPQIHVQAILMETLCQALTCMDNISPLKIPHTRQIAEQIRHYLDHHYQSDVPLRELAEMVHYSPCHLNMLFRKEIGLPIRQYVLKKRLEQAQHLLLTSDLEIKQIAYQVGFQDPLYFSRLFRKHFGQSPTKFEHPTLRPHPTTKSE